MRTSYTIDREYKIVSVDGLWDDFAAKNDGAMAMADQVIGRSIWEFVVGFEVQSFLNAVIFSVRQKNLEFESLYRCDSPDTPRLCRMNAISLPHGLVRVEHTLLGHPQLRPLYNVRSLVDRRCVNRCSMCCSFKVGDDWIDSFANPEKNFFPKSHVVCPTCKGEARRGLGEIIRLTGSRRSA